MRVYLIRHAHAVEAVEDPQRPLSRRGRKQVRALARFLKSVADFQPDVLWASPLVRAHETAGRLRQKLGFSAPLLTVPELETARGVAVLARRLQRSLASVALTGHEPHLSALASLLVTGREKPARFEFKKGAILALERSGTLWVATWQIHPGLL